MSAMDAARTLIADDQSDVLESLKLVLKNEGIQTETASSPAAVLDKIESHPFDLVLMDLNYARDTTSGGEGLDLLGRIQRIDKTLPVVAMTAWASVELAVEAMRRGAHDFVLKPWENSELVRILKRQIDQGRRRRSELRREREECEDARSIGLGLLPKSIPQIAGLQVAGESVAARSLSGDYFDVLDLGEGKLGLCIADVAGKGTAAALLMSNVQATVRAFASPSVGPVELVTKLNRSILRNATCGKFVTLFYCVLDARSRTIAYTNAGHCAPVLVRSGRDVQRLTEGGAVLGVFPDWAYEQRVATMGPGDRLLLFTDGASEAANSREEEFGEDRLAELAISLRERDAASIKDAILNEVRGFAGGALQDDATLVVVSAAD